MKRPWLAWGVALPLLYWLSGTLVLTLERDQQLITPLLFVPEGLALAAALRWGRRSWAGILIGQTALALCQQTPLWAGLALGLVNASVDVAGAAGLRRLGVRYPLQRVRHYAWHLLIVAVILQPISAFSGVAVLQHALANQSPTLTSPALLIPRVGSWWCGNTAAQLLLTPLLLDLPGLIQQLREPRRALMLLSALVAYGSTLLVVPRLVPLNASWTVPLLLVPILLISAVLIADSTVVALLAVLVELQIGLFSWAFGANVAQALLAALTLLKGLIICQLLAVLLTQNRSTLRELQAQFRERDRQLQLAQVASSVTHQIKQPLALLSLHFNRLTPTSANAEERQPAQWVRTMAECSDQVSQLLQVIKTKPQNGDLAQALQWCRLRTKGLPNPRGIQVTVQRPADADLQVHCNEALLAIVLDNLSRNALEACSDLPAGTGVVEISVHPCADGRLQLQVADNGPGLSFTSTNAKPDDLFTTKAGGTGLGLFLVQTIASHCNGTLHYGRSQLGGALVSLTFQPPMPTRQP